MIKYLIVFMVLLLVQSSHAATGDILWQCDFESAGTPAQVVAACGGGGATGASATIVTGGHDGGKAINYYYPNLGAEVVNIFSTGALNKQEITMEYWERFDSTTYSGLWNVKSMRPYVGPAGGDYLGSVMSRHNNSAWYESAYGGPTTLTTTSKVTNVVTGAGYCTGVSSPYTCPDVRLEVSWSSGWDTSWHKIRYYIKVPSSDVATDGETKAWIDDELLYTNSGISKSSLWSAGWHSYVSYVSFHPSDDFQQGFVSRPTEYFTFNHQYDDITIYEGYVPPGPENGVCAPTFTSSTTPTPICTTGTAGAISGTGTPNWNWQCSGINGGTSTAAGACMATYSAAPATPAGSAVRRASFK